MLVAGYSIRVSRETLGNIGPFFASLAISGALKKIPHQTGEVLAVYYDYDLDDKREYTLLYGHEVTKSFDPYDELKFIEVPDQNYRAFPCHGPTPYALANQWSAIWKMDLPRTYSYDIERHKEVPEILISVKSPL